MSNQNDTGLGSGLNDPSGIGGLTGSAGFGGGSTGFDNTRTTSTGTSTADAGSFGTGSFGASSTGTTEESSQDAATRARELASNLRSRATEKVEDRLSEQKYRAADSLGNIAQQIRSAGEQFPQDNAMGRYITQAAGQVDNLASFLNNRDVSDLMDEVEQLARRQPAVFIGGAFALGVLGARFLKSSRRNLGYDYQDRWSSREAMLDMPRDSVNRPGAPGYSPATERTSTGYGATGSSTGTGSYGGTGSQTGLGSSGMSGTSGLGGTTGTGSTGTGLGTSGTGLGRGETGYGSTGSGTSSSGYGTSGSGLGGSGNSPL